MSKSLSVKTLIVSIIITVMSMTVMFLYSANKMVVIADSASDYISDDEEGDIINVEVMDIRGTNPEANAFTINVPSEVKAETVIVENKTLDRELWIYLDRVDISDFESANVEGNVTPILSAYLQEVRGGTWIKFQMRGLFECVTTLENGVLSITANKPKSIYDKVLVLDSDGSDTADAVVELVRAKLDNYGAKVYCANTLEENLSVKRRLGIAEDSDADFYLKIQVASSDDSELYGVDSYYNENYFTPILDGAALADTIERNLVLNTYTTGYSPLGGSNAYEELSIARLPAVLINIGYSSNPQESLLLNKDSYRERIAEGIYNGICEKYAGREY